MEAIGDFYDAMLEHFWIDPEEGNRGPSVAELRTCEKTCLKAAFRLCAATKCPLEDALVSVMKDGMFRNLLGQKPADKNDKQYKGMTSST